MVALTFETILSTNTIQTQVQIQDMFQRYFQLLKYICDVHCQPESFVMVLKTSSDCSYYKR